MHKIVIEISVKSNVYIKQEFYEIQREYLSKLFFFR